ncbi:response regulator transcription factor [Paenibacillus sp. Leaf72]|uniref:response regulator transcription factor n=1 Tax=Paenibacillus sp. Leaf72 TaxID=1736234 RepID=UPI00070034DB|nr:helix-turn-helix domain-containing protein [Paenibacillus sp. Leaf72]KQN97714.1 two-component system response regulator [Paenibacillus sp. Leaf72]
MFKVVIADDHYPVLDYLSNIIPWSKLGFELSALCSNGGEAWEACQNQQPDILITDIGMPVMDGLDLIEKAREANPRLKTIILSCHEDFQYAQRAVKLNVNDYILKESLRMEHVVTVLQQLACTLAEEKQAENNRLQLQNVVQQNLSAIHTRFIRKLLEQPIWNEAEWNDEAERMGIHLRDGMPYLPVAVLPERSFELASRFGGAMNMQFVIDNALQELVQYEGVILLVPNERQYFLLFPFPATLKRNLHEDIRSELKRVQQLVYRHLSIGISFYRGDVARDFLQLKKQLQDLMNVKMFRFYAGELVFAELRPLQTTKEDLFLHYAKAFQELKDSMLGGERALIQSTVKRWGAFIQDRVYPVESVKSWVLKMALELELKYTVMQNFVINFNSELQQQQIASIETLNHLLEWLQNFLEEKATDIQMLRDHTVRREIAEAQRYIQTHIGEKIAMDEMAHRLNLNPSHFSRIFKQETGETFVEFVTRTKMEKAKELLNQSDMTVVEIAEQLGYEHTSYFIKLFRNASGMSPNEFRKSM